MALRYTNQELADMLLIYGECHKNARRAAALYAVHYPDRRHPAYSRVYIVDFANLELHESTRPRNVRERDEQVIQQVREAVSANPHTSTRCVGRELNLHNVRVHRIIKKNLQHLFKRYTTQQLLPQDLPRREQFCDWITDQVDIENIANDNFLRKILWTDECTFRSDGRINLLLLLSLNWHPSPVTSRAGTIWPLTRIIFRVTERYRWWGERCNG
ncbi:uncharacterized protein LOC105206480 [Solenopsis invicta]|uniref:uncharacterized protein LOC105206480 n=1 Tax=Solenopsis invicta TaxID=13686 RepID=UPI000595ADAA|nr:uncharacterized protein LOC105206480 [Solenopsis invicta]